MAEKVYLLEPPSRKKEEARLRQVAQAAAQAAVTAQAQSAPRIQVENVPEAWVKPASSAGRRALHPANALLTLYTLGGVAPLALRVGPRKFAWATASALSLAGWVTLVWYWSSVRAMMLSGRLPVLPVLLGLAIVHVVGALAWTRAVVQVVRDERFKSQTLPRWLRHPSIVGVAGLVMPGSGLAVAGRHIRAAAAMWNGANVVLAGLVLGHAGLLWTWNAKASADAMPKAFLEALLLASAIVVCLGGLAWIAAALDGARLAEASRASERGGRNANSIVRADAITLALVGSLVAFAVVVHPASVARDLDRFAGSMRFAGYRVIPLLLQSTAAALDAGRPEYQMRLAELHTEMGHPEQARLIHERLRERWDAYAKMVLQMPAATRAAPPLQPIQPAGDLVPRSKELAPSVAPPAAPRAH